MGMPPSIASGGTVFTANVSTRLNIKPTLLFIINAVTSWPKFLGSCIGSSSTSRPLVLADGGHKGQF
jgi:hypothetical protein